ncbi:GntR family transcriptional regulator [Rathayibacter sp. VKM Ac-2760]|uniref:GntR family transcriptional regulator n=1 Tax=Rathayibacter sp. VKM Ac-2760 TaxID=2609253 RepID=UPI0013181C49|nr:GntR family transcriptional regulator [Rathayibacter sp. VKM Ac-2760]QHC58784.1 GntR family transcriptional regulator [Rathayibacter sp. VKM Ac-2760]
MAPVVPVERGSALTAWGQVLRDLRRRLDTGEFPPGTPLPAESALVAQYEVSRITVRRAIAELVAQDRVITKPGSGTYAGTRRDTRVHLDLSLPWREQVLAAGRVARTENASGPSPEGAPPTSVALLDPAAARAARPMVRRLHSVDGAPVGMTDAWITDRGAVLPIGEDERVLEYGVLDLEEASQEQAAALHAPVLAQLIVITARSSLASTGETIGFSRTWWVASRVRLARTRALAAGAVDVPLFGHLSSSPDR